MWGGLIFKFLGWFGGDAFNRVVTAVAGYLQQKANDRLAAHQAEVGGDVQLALARANAEVEARRLQAQLLAADGGWWVTRWMRPLAFYVCLVHFAAIVLDSTFRFHWAIPALPAPYDGYEQYILLSIIIARPFEKAARLFTARS